MFHVGICQRPSAVVTGVNDRQDARRILRCDGADGAVASGGWWGGRFLLVKDRDDTTAAATERSRRDRNGGANLAWMSLRRRCLSETEEAMAGDISERRAMEGEEPSSPSSQGQGAMAFEYSVGIVFR